MSIGGDYGTTQFEERDRTTTAIIAIRSLQKDFFAGGAKTLRKLRELGDPAMMLR
jgi:hypothetical protein